MALGTYTELQAAVADFLNRDDLAASVATFIALAEAGLERDLRTGDMEATNTLPVTARFTDLPADFLQPIRLYIAGATKSLVPMSFGEMQDERYRTGDAGGTITGYSITAGRLELFPSPGAETDVEMYYYATLDKLSDAAPTNWLLTKAPDSYLYGALVHSAPYLKDDSRIQLWAGLYQAAIDKLNTTSEASKWGGGSLRIRANGR
jgi:hypothetical protein